MMGSSDSVCSVAHAAEREGVRAWGGVVAGERGRGWVFAVTVG